MLIHNQHVLKDFGIAIFGHGLLEVFQFSCAVGGEEARESLVRFRPTPPESVGFEHARGREGRRCHGPYAVIYSLSLAFAATDALPGELKNNVIKERN